MINVSPVFNIASSWNYVLRWVDGDKSSAELPDCEYESLLELFRYAYSDEVDLIMSGSNVMGVSYLAKK